MPLSDFLFNAIILFLGGVLSFMTWTYVSKSRYFALCVLTFMYLLKIKIVYAEIILEPFYVLQSAYLVHSKKNKVLEN